MLDRQKVEAILGRRFTGAARDQVAAAANAIMGLSDEWEEVPHDASDCYLTGDVEPDIEFRVFKRRQG